jgi:hypothetical protein
MVADPMRIVAIICGVVSSLGASIPLLQDGFRTGHWTVEHALLPMLMLVSILTGHLFQAALRDWRPLTALGFLIVSTTSMWGIIYTSVGNHTQVTETNVKAAESNNAERTLLLKERACEVDMLDDERKALARECASGNGTRCSGKMVAVGTYENAVVGIDTKLSKLGPEVPVQAKADRMASLIAALCDRDQGMVKRFLLLIEPFTYSLIFEVCALVSFSFGFSHRRTPREYKQQQTVPTEPANTWHTVSTVAAPSEPSVPSGPPIPSVPKEQPEQRHSNVVTFPLVEKSTRNTKGYKLHHAEQTILRYLQQHGSSDALGTSTRELSEALGLEKTTFWRACTELAVAW